MLNTESRLTSLVVWLTVAYIVAQFAWTLFDWPPLHVMVRTALDSDAAALAGRNQTLIGAVVGLGGLALAYVFNGWRDRAEARHAVERREKRMAGVLAREAEDIASSAEQAARQLAAARGGAGAGKITSTLAGAIAPSGTVLMGGAMPEIATLGAGAGAATRAVRAAATRLVGAIEAGRDDAAGLKTIAVNAMETAVAARDAARLFGLVERRGPVAGDRLRLLPAPATGELEAQLGLTSDAAPASRLLPAA